MKKAHVRVGILVLIIVVAGITLIWFLKSKKGAEEQSSPSPQIATKEVARNNEGEEHAKNRECPLTFVSWNLANFGKSKSDETIEAMAKIACESADLYAVQEITASKSVGAQTVAKLAQACSEFGSDWGYLVSDPTFSVPNSGVERYSFLFKKSTVSVNNDTARLVKELEEPIDREPFTAIFQLKNAEALSAYTMHAVPTAKNPMKEIQALENSIELKAVNRALFSGDFNLGAISTDPSFNSLGFRGNIAQPTSLKTEVVNGKYAVKQYDNIYSKGVKVCSSGVIDFVSRSFSPVTDNSLKEARKLSDHLPVYITFK